MSVEVVMIRHAQSTWNAEGRFTGWANPPLNAFGEAEAAKAGKTLKQSGYQFDQVYSSYLQRAETTARILLAELGKPNTPMALDWRLNERHYGDLQGKSKTEMAETVGKEQVHRWRRGYKDTPPPLAYEDPRHPRFDPIFKDIAPEQLPGVESLADTRARAMAFWQDKVVPDMAEGKRVLIAAHGNTLRGIIMALSKMSESEVETFEIPTGTPIVYSFDADGTPLSWKYLQADA